MKDGIKIAIAFGIGLVTGLFIKTGSKARKNYIFEESDRINDFSDDYIQDEEDDNKVIVRKKFSEIVTPKKNVSSRKVVEVRKATVMEDKRFTEYKYIEDLVENSNDDTEYIDVFYNVEKNIYYIDDEINEVDDPFDGDIFKFDSDEYYIRDNDKNINYTLMVIGAYNYMPWIEESWTGHHREE